MRVLVTNDDGVTSAGIAALTTVACDLGLDVLVAAPAWNFSGASASLAAVTDDDGRYLFEPCSLPRLGERRVEAYAVQAAPAFITHLALRGAFGAPPEFVLSGVNHGPNTGHAILHSGTVGAALTAATHGVAGVAVSLGTGGECHVSTAAEVARPVIEWAMAHPDPVVLNVNVPDVPRDEVRGLRRAPLASFGAVTTQVTEVGAGTVTLQFDEIDPSGEPGSDATLLHHGWATVTALNPVCEAGIQLAGLDLE